MTLPRVILLHGWGLDAGLFGRLVGCLPGIDADPWDRGYFGAPHASDCDDVAFGIGHSLGALLLAEALPPRVPLVAINGFDRFAGEGAVPLRLLDRMRRRFTDAPAEVLGEFRTRIGAGCAPEALVAAPLASDLDRLADERAVGGERRILSLQGGADPLLPPTMRARVFEGAARATRPDAGHLLPLTHPEWCAEQIGAFAWA